ncbi:MAG: LLM class F420-dependent oxidoreductase [Anaerolineales bacterium]|nr:LLM class F420-dependent oxidoreductase [Anaerolineales bacterium]
MKIGLVFPQIEFPPDPLAIRDYAQTAEGLSFTHILAYDHVLGANPDRPGGWQGPYTYQDPFQEPLTLFSYLAALTQRIEFATGVIILPQRQTALFAKQAACLDVLSGGRLRVGLGLGWNQVEYAALNEDFHNRGRRFEEQVQALRLLWTQPLVNFRGRWHTIQDAGLNPMPIQRPIPLWFGGHAEAVLRRVARLGDGWMPNYRSALDARPALDQIGRFLDEAGRSWADLGLEPRLPHGDGNPASWLKTIQEWQGAGATHLSFNTMGCGFDTPEKHLQAVRAFAAALGLPGR